MREAAWQAGSSLAARPAQPGGSEDTDPSVATHAPRPFSQDPALGEDDLPAHKAILLFPQAFVRPLISNDFGSSGGKEEKTANRRFNVL